MGIGTPIGPGDGFVRFLVQCLFFGVACHALNVATGIIRRSIDDIFAEPREPNLHERMERLLGVPYGTIASMPKNVGPHGLAGTE